MDERMCPRCRSERAIGSRIAGVCLNCGYAWEPIQAGPMVSVAPLSLKGAEYMIAGTDIDTDTACYRAADGRIYPSADARAIHADARLTAAGWACQDAARIRARIAAALEAAIGNAAAAERLAGVVVKALEGYE